jgi:hypothetical protein
MKVLCHVASTFVILFEEEYFLNEATIHSLEVSEIPVKCPDKTWTTKICPLFHTIHSPQVCTETCFALPNMDFHSIKSANFSY